MDASSRREYLEQLVDTAESDAVRLKALELLERLDEREGRKPLTSAEVTEAYAERLADDPERLQKLIDLHFEHLEAFPSFREAVERRAEALVEERALAARESFAVVDEESGSIDPVSDEVGVSIGTAPTEASQRNDRSEVQAGDPEVGSEPEDAPERPDGLSPEVLARQWPQRRRGLRDVRPSTILRQDDRD